uniref:G_PROTEIN_RECEP_F1_2 domain-containing protein n=1 Tax=Meloidogyne hapla TaxID=6305 RepID=A0A1I8BW19_MELHA
MLHKDYRQNSCYRIMFAVCLADIFQLLANGLFIFLRLINFEFSEGFEQWGGAVNASSWNILFFLQLLLALNRCSVVLKNCFLISIKEQELPWERRLFNRRGKQNTVEILSRQERRILLQVIIVFLMNYFNKFQTSSQFLPLSLLMVCGYLLPEDASLDLIAFLNVGTMLVCGINPFLYLALNVQFRERFLLMICCRKAKKNKFVMAQPPKSNIAKIGIGPSVSPNGVTLTNNMINVPKRVNSMPIISK